MPDTACIVPLISSPSFKFNLTVCHRRLNNTDGFFWNRAHLRAMYNICKYERSDSPIPAIKGFIHWQILFTFWIQEKKNSFSKSQFLLFFNHWIYLMCNLLFYLDFLFSQNTQDFMNYGLDFCSQWVTNNVYISCIKNKSGLQVLVWKLQIEFSPYLHNPIGSAMKFQ